MQMLSDIPICTFLSGGVDSSLVTAICAKELDRQGKQLNTFSFDFVNNDRYFKANSFQPSQDRPWVDRMVEASGTNHTYLECNNEQQIENLYRAVDARDLPCMADVESSLPVSYTHLNQYLEIFKLDDYEEPKRPAGEIDLEEILTKLTDEAYDRYIIKSNDVVTRDLFDTKLMGVLVPRPSQVIRDFREKYQKSPEAATEFFYKFSQDTDYIRRYRVKKDWKWTVDSPYGIIDITVNLSKPEKDPKAIAAAKNAAQSRYPKCQLCMENEGYAGHIDVYKRQGKRQW